jgi:hypothetical protein
VAANVNQCLSMIKGIEAQLSLFALNFQDDTAKRILHESMLVMEEVKNDLQSRITELELQEPQYKN